MNQTMPPEDTPLYRIIDEQERKSCLRCEHLWYVNGLYGCGISGKLILGMFVKESGCDKFKKDKEEGES